MSYDIKLQNLCDHKINWQKSDLETDRKTVYLGYPVASQASLRMRVNNVIVSSNDYGLEYNTKKMSLEKKYFLIMKSKVKLNAPLIECQYVTFADVCPKCEGIKTVDDMIINPSGDITLARIEYLLLQNMEKSIVTKVSSNPFHFWYGTNLQDLIGTKVVNMDFLRSKITEQIVSSIDKLQNVQRQMVASGRKMDPGELFGKLLKIDVQQTDDPTYILVIVSFTSQNQKQLEYSQYMQFGGEARERVSFA